MKDILLGKDDTRGKLEVRQSVPNTKMVFLRSLRGSRRRFPAGSHGLVSKMP
jgi:hypothetical protein